MVSFSVMVFVNLVFGFHLNYQFIAVGFNYLTFHYHIFYHCLTFHHELYILKYLITLSAFNKIINNQFSQCYQRINLK